MDLANGAWKFGDSESAIPGHGGDSSREGTRARPASELNLPRNSSDVANVVEYSLSGA
jgi:hypothetical protein